jgi:hypothetical protein
MDSWFNDLNTLRIEAMSLFERSFKDGAPDKLLAFVEAQIMQEPPPVQLLHEIAEDLHRRLQALRRLQFELRAHTLATLRDNFGINLAPVLPLSGYDPRLSADVIIAGLLPGDVPDEVALRKTLDIAYEASLRVTDDILMVEGMYDFLVDWANALSTKIARESGIEGAFDDPPTPLQ